MAGTTAAVRDRLRSLLRDEEVAENLSALAVRQRHLQRVLDVPAEPRPTRERADRVGCSEGQGSGQPLALHAPTQSKLASALDQMCVTPPWGHFTELPVSTDR